MSPSAWDRTTASGATIFDALDYAMGHDYEASGESDYAHELNPTIAIIASKFGDPTGKYATYINKTEPYYTAQPYYALSSSLSDVDVLSNVTEQKSSSASTWSMIHLLWRIAIVTTGLVAMT